MKKYALLAYYNNAELNEDNYEEQTDLFLRNIKHLALDHKIIIDICQAGSDDLEKIYFDACVEAKNKKAVLAWLKSDVYYISSTIELIQ
jgi:hypothetical protein